MHILSIKNFSIVKFFFHFVSIYTVRTCIVFFFLMSFFFCCCFAIHLLMDL